MDVSITDKQKRERPADRPGAPPQEKLQILLVGLDHLLDHLAADRACLAAGQVDENSLLLNTSDILKISFPVVER